MSAYRFMVNYSSLTISSSGKWNPAEFRALPVLFGCCRCLETVSNVLPKDPASCVLFDSYLLFIQLWYNDFRRNHLPLNVQGLFDHDFPRISDLFIFYLSIQGLDRFAFESALFSRWPAIAFWPWYQYNLGHTFSKTVFFGIILELLSLPVNSNVYKLSSTDSIWYCSIHTIVNVFTNSSISRSASISKLHRVYLSSLHLLNPAINDQYRSIHMAWPYFSEIAPAAQLHLWRQYIALQLSLLGVESTFRLCYAKIFVCLFWFAGFISGGRRFHWIPLRLGKDLPKMKFLKKFRFLIGRLDLDFLKVFASLQREIGLFDLSPKLVLSYSYWHLRNLQ